MDPVIPPPPARRDTPERDAHLRGLVLGARRRRARFASRAEARTWWAERPLFAGWDPRALDLYVAEARSPWDAPPEQVEIDEMQGAQLRALGYVFK